MFQSQQLTSQMAQQLASFWTILLLDLQGDTLVCDMHGAEMCKGFGFEHLKNRDWLEDTDRGRYIRTIVLRWILQSHLLDSSGLDSE